MAFDENGEVPATIYEKILLGKLETNLGMVIENMVAQMLKAKDRRLYFYTVPETEDKEDRMEIDFLIAKSKITSRHNICPIEVKSGRRKFSTSSLEKFNSKYHEQLHTSLVLHDGDVQQKDDFIYLPLYMAPLL